MAAYSKDITTWIANYTSDGTDMTLPIAAFAEIDSADAHTSTGDIRHFIFGLCEQFADQWYSHDSGTNPTKMTINRSSSQNSSNVITRTYTFTFSLTPSGTIEVTAES